MGNFCVARKGVTPSKSAAPRGRELRRRPPRIELRYVRAGAAWQTPATGSAALPRRKTAGR